MLRRPDIDHILRAAAVISSHVRFVVVGTGAVIITAKHIPVAMMMTAEIDLYADGVADPEPISDLIDPAILGRWLANKTPEIVASWIEKPGNTVLMAVEDDAILGVGSVTDAGEITLNYVSPDARFRGVSRTVIEAPEERAMRQGNERCHLLSTETARGFYHRAGYTEDGPPVGEFGSSGSYPMSTALVPPLYPAATPNARTRN